MSSSGSLYVAPSSGIVFRARRKGCLNAYLDPLANNDRVESPSRDHSLNLRDLGAATVDMFATVYNTPLPQFMSPIPELQALAIHALSQG